MRISDWSSDVCPSDLLYATPAASSACIHIMTSSPLVTCALNLSTLASTLLGTQAVELFTMAKLFEYSARNVAASAMKSGADGCFLRYARPSLMTACAQL